MGNFNQGSRFGGKKSFGRDRDSSMHQAICSDCGQKCSVPFKPTGDKPVYCSDCFSKKESGGNNRFPRRDSGRPSFGDKKMFTAVCDKCHNECEVPFKPTGDKAVYCNDCFRSIDKPGAGARNSGGADYQKQFEMLNAKLDNLLKILAPKEVAAPKKIAKVAKAVKPVKIVKAAKAVKKVAAKKKK